MIEALIAHLKSKTPYNETGTFKLWEALTNLDKDSTKLNILVLENLLDNIVETPEGLIDGANKKYYLSQKPINNFILGFKSGLLLFKNTDFQMKDNLITFTVAPAGGSTLQFIYQVRR